MMFVGVRKVVPWGLLLVFLLVGACTCDERLTPPEKSAACELKDKPSLVNDMRWLTSDEKPEHKFVYGCLRFLWPDGTDPETRLVVVKDDGTVLDAEGFDADPTSQAPLRFDSPLKNQPQPTLDLLVFARQGTAAADKVVHKTLCYNAMDKPSYSCLDRSKEECWFAWHRTPKEGGGTDCELLYRDTTVSEGTPDAGPDAILTDRGCAGGSSRTCLSSKPGECERGFQYCVDSVWGPCLAGPAKTEICHNLRDDDCDGLIDEGPECLGCRDGSTKPCYTGPAGTMGTGNCKGGTQTCKDRVWGTCLGQVIPVPEICDGRDNNCNSRVDDVSGGCMKCTENDSRPCYLGTSQTRGVGACTDGKEHCVAGSWGSCAGSVLPSAEACNGHDNDCDGVVDNGCITVTTFAGPVNKASGPAKLPWFGQPSGIVAKGQGSFYVADSERDRILVWERNGDLVRSYAGGGRGYRDGARSQAQFDQPHGLAFGPKGSLFVADYGNKKIRKITSAGVVSTLALFSAFLDGPKGIAVDANGVIYVADTKSHTIVYGKETGPIKYIGLRSTSGFANGSGAAVRFFSPHGLAVQSLTALFVADTDNQVIRRFDLTSEMVTTYAGIASKKGSANGKLTSAQFHLPIGVAFDDLGDLYIGDSGNHQIRKIDVSNASPTVTTLAGLGTPGQSDGKTDAALLTSPSWISVGGAKPDSKVFFTEPDAPMVREVNLHGILLRVSALVGEATEGLANGVATASKFHSPTGLALSSTGELLIADSGNFVLRKIDVARRVSTFTGDGMVGDVVGARHLSRFSMLTGLAAADLGGVYALDADTHHVRHVDGRGSTTYFAGTRVAGFKDDLNLKAEFYAPQGVARFKNTTTDLLYIADTLNHCIRKVDLMTNKVSTVAGKLRADGKGCVQGSVDGLSTDALFHSPYGIAVDTLGNIYIADTENHRIRKIIALTGYVTTLAGGRPGYLDGAASVSRFQGPRGVVVDTNNNVYIADTGNHAIRKIDRLGTISTIAGDCTSTKCFEGYYNGPGKVAAFSRPTALVVDAAGNLLVSDTDNHRIRKIQLK